MGMIGCYGRTDEDRSQYTGGLCGLGWDPSTGKGLYEDHDIECTFDTVFTQEDLDQVRQPFCCNVEGRGRCYYTELCVLQ